VQIHREHAQPRISSQGMNSSVPKTQNSGEEINQTQRERERKRKLAELATLVQLNSVCKT
jgi:hypothetical protein